MNLTSVHSWISFKSLGVNLSRVQRRISLSDVKLTNVHTWISRVHASLERSYHLRELPLITNYIFQGQDHQRTSLTLSCSQKFHPFLFFFNSQIILFHKIYWLSIYLFIYVVSFRCDAIKFLFLKRVNLFVYAFRSRLFVSRQKSIFS